MEFQIADGNIHVDEVTARSAGGDAPDIMVIPGWEIEMVIPGREIEKTTDFDLAVDKAVEDLTPAPGR